MEETKRIAKEAGGRRCQVRIWTALSRRSCGRGSCGRGSCGRRRCNRDPPPPPRQWTIYGWLRRISYRHVGSLALSLSRSLAFSLSRAAPPYMCRGGTVWRMVYLMDLSDWPSAAVLLLSVQSAYPLSYRYVCLQTFQRRLHACVCCTASVRVAQRGSLFLIPIPRLCMSRAHIPRLAQPDRTAIFRMVALRVRKEGRSGGGRGWGG